MNMSTAYLLVGLAFGCATPWHGGLAFVVGTYYITSFVVSTLLTATGFWWYACFVLMDMLLAMVLSFGGFGFLAKLAATVLVMTACISAYAGREGGFLYHYYPGIMGAMNVLFIFLVIWQLKVA